MKFSTFKILFILVCISLLVQTVNAQTDIDKTIKQNIEDANSFMQGGNIVDAARLYSQTAYLLRNQGKSKESVVYYKKVLDINQTLNNERGIELTHSNLAIAFIEFEDYANAILHLYQQLKYQEKANRTDDIISTLTNIASSENELGKYDDAAKNIQRVISLATEGGSLDQIKQSYGVAYEIYDKSGNQEMSKKYFELYSAIDKKLKEQKMADIQNKAATEMNKALTDKQKTEEILDITNKELKQTTSDLEKVEMLTKEQQMELDLKQAKINEQDALLKIKTMRVKFFAFGFSVLLVFIIVLIIMVLKIRAANRKINSQRERLEKQNIEIKGSISYANTIQTAMLPEIEGLQKYFEPFIINMPKDIVSGDFYWYSETNHGDKSVYFAVVDCTGHGVPGAFMSLIGINFLNEIVSEHKDSSPAEMLRILNEMICKGLRQDHTDNNDGMDVALIKLTPLKDKGNYQLTYAGAKRPIYIGRANGELEHFAPTRSSIGGIRTNNKELNFTDTDTAICKNDIVYMSSDGIYDQNNKSRNKFGREKVEVILKNILKDDMARQKNVLLKELTDFMENEPQRDDITFIGLRIK